MAKQLILRSVNKDMTSYGGFVWPTSGTVRCPNPNRKKECGGGLHGLLWGQGDASLLSPADGLGIVFSAEEEDIIDLQGKVKCVGDCEVLFVGKDIKEAAIWLSQQSKYFHTGCGIAIAGHYGTATAGAYGAATAGAYGTATTGDYGKAIAGYRGTATAGNYGKAIAGDRGTATAGDYGSAATAGDYGTATTGNGGKATAGNYGTATTGDYGTATAGYSGTATAGDVGILQISWLDGERKRIAIAYVGENGILPNKKYKLDEKGNFVLVS